MRKNPIAALLLSAALFVVGVLGMLPASAEEWSWANYGFSGTAIANPDPYEPTAYLVGGYVASVNHLHPLPASYVYQSSIVLDTEGVALRFRFSWTNTEQGYKAVADHADGIAVYPMDESLDVAIATEDGVERFSFPVPAAYDYMEANAFAVADNGQYMTVSVADKVVAVLRYAGTRTAGGKTCFEEITLTDGNGYVYGRIAKPLVLASGGYVGYSSQADRALILIKEHSLAETVIDFDSFPEEKETTEGWIPETEPKETAPESLPETPPETNASIDVETPPETMTDSTLETLPAQASGCGAVAGVGCVTICAVAAAVLLGKKKD